MAVSAIRDIDTSPSYIDADDVIEQAMYKLDKIIQQPMLPQYDTENGYTRIGVTKCLRRTVQNVELKRNTENIEGCRNIVRFARRVVLSWTQRRKIILAQLYKMTLYACDLEEDLSLDEIKRLIKDDALDGISIRCATHFANEKVGAHIDWDDNIDINYTNSTTEQWEKYFDDGEQRILCDKGKGVCPNCHRLDSIDPLARYCRYCGAKLKGEM